MPPKPLQSAIVKQMQRTVLLGLTLFITFRAFSQKKSNPTIGRNETEVSSFVLADNYVAFGAELVYRLSVIKNLKIGAGALYGANYDVTFDHGYGAVFADAMQFLGNRQKWSFGGQIGHGFYNNDYGLKAGIYYSISCNYRAIVSKRLLFTTSYLIGYRNFHTEEGIAWQEYFAFMGLKFGVVF